MTIIDMTIPGMRKRVAVIAGIARIKMELHGLTSRTSTLKAMQGWGFKSKRKKSMLAEILAWHEENRA